jgi:AraC-like DNA-binding protein
MLFIADWPGPRRPEGILEDEPSMPRPGVSIALVRTLVAEVTRAGIAADDFLARAGFEDAPLADASARVDLGTYDRLQELALDLTGDPALGLHMGARAPLVTFDMVGSMSAHCSTIREAIEVFRRFRRLVSDCDAPALHEQGEQAILTFYFIRGSERCSRLRAELGIAALVRFAFQSAMTKPRSAVIEFEHAAPSYAGEYPRVLGFPVTFGQRATRIVFERRILDAPQLHADAEVERLLEGQANRRLQALSVASSVAARVRAVVAQECGRTRPSMNEVARRMSVSSRSLRRHLQDEGVTFTEIVEDAIADVARRLLADPAITIQEVAGRLGFSEASSFHRAFKRWTGMTPREFREAPRTRADG